MAGRNAKGRPCENGRSSNRKPSPLLSAETVPRRVEVDGALEARRRILDGILSQYWEHHISRHPELSSILGYKRKNDRLYDFSQEAIDEDLTKAKDFLVRLEAIHTDGLTEQEKLNRCLLVRQLREDVEHARFKEWEIPLNPVKSIHLQIAQRASLLRFESLGDYEDFISGLHQIPRLLDEVMMQMKKGMAEGLVPPRLLLSKVILQLQALVRGGGDGSPFMRPLHQFPPTISDQSRRLIRGRLIAAVHYQVLPAYSKLEQFLKEQYWPRARETLGLWALPDGTERYAAAVRRSTTTCLTPEEIHHLGLAQVAQIEKQMSALAGQLKFADLRSFRFDIEQDRRLRARSRQHILRLYRGYLEGIEPELHRLFDRVPATGIEVRPIEPFREKESPDAQYVPGAEDGHSPAYVLVNTSHPTRRKTISIEANAYHEAWPGHHLQVYLARESAALSTFRQHASYPAFDEG